MPFTCHYISTLKNSLACYPYVQTKCFNFKSKNDGKNFSLVTRNAKNKSCKLDNSYGCANIFVFYC